jgi:threonine/homoserine/homoserine lactone efflux protein
MVTFELLFAFIFASVIACLIPGPAILLVVSKTISKGLPSALKAVWGLQTGFALQIIAAASGLSALILKSAFLFIVLKYIGSIYLFYLGVSLLLKKEGHNLNKELEDNQGNSPFFEGILINILNPKIAIFFISYVPQFIDKNAISPVRQLIMFGFIFCIIGTLTTIGYALTSGLLSKNINNSQVGSIFTKWVPGAIFLGFGVKLAITEK